MSKDYDFRRKKLRGWKRKVKEVEQWKSSYMNIDMGTFTERKRDYVKLWGCTFYSLNKYTLPFWYKRLIIESLIEIYDSWKQSLDELNEFYYLKVWIFEGDMMHSQVVASYRGMLTFYDNTFSEMEKVKTLPNELATVNAASLLWHKSLFLIPWSENELVQDERDGIYTSEEIQKLKKSAYAIKNERDDTIFLIKEDDVWLGEQ